MKAEWLLGERERIIVLVSEYDNGDRCYAQMAGEEGAVGLDWLTDFRLVSTD